jgi:hypothetical protein
MSKAEYNLLMEDCYWENGERVGVVGPEYEAKRNYPNDSDALIMMRTLVGFLQKSPHPALSISCLSLITGIGYEGKSMAQIARETMVSRAAVSRRCVDLCNLLGIPPTRAMRNESGRVNCRKAQTERQKKLVEKHLS